MKNGTTCRGNVALYQYDTEDFSWYHGVLCGRYDINWDADVHSETIITEINLFHRPQFMTSSSFPPLNWLEKWVSHAQNAVCAEDREAAKLRLYFEEFRTMRHRLAWLGHKFPDLMSPANIFVQTTPKTFTSMDIRIIGKIVSRSRENESRRLVQWYFDVSSLILFAFTD